MSNILLQKYILDPLSTIIKLAVLGKKHIGCKILIKNNQIFIQENGIFQGIARYYMGVTKNDIHYLSIPIELACKRYLVINKINTTPDLVIIFKCAQDGLNNLMETYNTHPIIIHCLKYYHSIIDTYLHLISCQQQISYTDKSQPKPKNSSNEKQPIYKQITPDTTKLIKIPKAKNKENISTESSETFHTPTLNIEYLNPDHKEPVQENIEINDPPKITEHESEITEEQQKTKEFELLLLYTDELLNKFDLVWDKSKIKIVIDMIKYLLEEKSASEYAAYIETFMIPIDKEILRIIYEKANITSE